MPAARSRTENWRRSLQNIYERNGALEITLPHHIDNSDGSNSYSPGSLIWRVRIIGINEREILVEEPSALGQTIDVHTGVELVCIIAVGQNRWMFRTKTLGKAKAPLNAYRIVTALRLEMPKDVERCQRRNFYRVSTVGVTLPAVDCYPLLNPESAAVAEAANRVAILDAVDASRTKTLSPKLVEDLELPQVGPRLGGHLMNIGGGGVGLMFDEADGKSLDAQRLYYLRIALMPEIPLPLAVTARLRHTHMDSAHRIYAGMAFEFGFHPQHEKFIVDQLCRYVADLQRDQLRRSTSADME